MAEQSVRQQARRAAFDTKTRLRAERAARERAVEQAAETVLVELATRDATVQRCELAAGRALEQLVATHGLTASEAGRWCGGLGLKEVARLRQLARTQVAESEPEPEPATPSTAAASVGPEVGRR